MKRNWITAAALAALLVASGQAPAQERKPVATFGGIEAMSRDAAKAKAQAWLKDAGKTDAATQAKFDAVWSAKDRSVLDQLADTFELGDAAAAKLMREGRSPEVPAPTKSPEVFRDAKLPTFFRANLALAYARALCTRRVHEEALDVLKQFNPDQTVDPASYLFHRAVSEHAMLQKPEATKTIRRLLDEASASSPERYKTVALLMQLDMAAWRDKDLGAIARKMENVERRLDLARGGEKTQGMQKEIVARLDEMIKKLENQAKQKQQPGQGQGNGGQCPSGGDQPGSGPPSSSQSPPSSPAEQPFIGSQTGPGTVDPLKMKKLVEQWGRLPPRQQADALQALTSGMPARHREAIENYFRNLSASTSKR